MAKHAPCIPSPSPSPASSSSSQPPPFLSSQSQFQLQSQSQPPRSPHHHHHHPPDNTPTSPLSLNPFALLAGSAILAVPFLLPRPDPCIIQSLRLREEARAFERSLEVDRDRARISDTVAVFPDARTSLDAIVQHCRDLRVVLLLRNGNGEIAEPRDIDVGNPTHRRVFESGLYLCVKSDCDQFERGTQRRNDCVLECKRLWTLPPSTSPAEEKHDEREPHSGGGGGGGGGNGNSLSMAVQNAQSDAVRLAAHIGGVITRLRPGNFHPGPVVGGMVAGEVFVPVPGAL
ncbi:MAG: hypothetical protein M1816_000134 [Peltula sp. TS41687]|nr:MAG: hypothetical protein M1816_000134 [Peltula sp. TS41687]